MEYQVANIGFYGIEIYSPSEDAWHSGGSFPDPYTYVYRTATVQRGRDSFLLFGGITNLDQYSRDVFEFTEDGLRLVKQNVLNVARNRHIAVSIPDYQVDCS